jgi:alpha-1,2-mannosyltransferase
VLIGLATIKPQLGLVLPLVLFRRAPIAASPMLPAGGLGTPGRRRALPPSARSAWEGFLHFTSPAMSNVLLTGQPPDFAGGLISVFALARPLGVHPALIIQGIVTLAAILAAIQARSVPRISSSPRSPARICMITTCSA